MQMVILGRDLGRDKVLHSLTRSQTHREGRGTNLAPKRELKSARSPVDSGQRLREAHPAICATSSPDVGNPPQSHTDSSQMCVRWRGANRTEFLSTLKKLTQIPAESKAKMGDIGLSLALGQTKYSSN